MAKQKEQLNDDLDLDFDFDDNDFDLGDDYGPSDRGRKPSLLSDIKEALSDDIDFRRNDARLRRELMKASLPSDYTTGFEAYDTVSNEVGTLWREQQREWEKHRPGLKRAIRPFADAAGALGFKSFAEWANSPERSRDNGPDQDQLDELKVQSVISDVFGQYAEQQEQRDAQLEAVRQEKEDERFADEQAHREVADKRDISSNQYLMAINKNTASVKAFNNNIVFPALKKDIELQARNLIVNQRLLSVLSGFREDSIKELTGIHKNTGLPDYLKIKPSEMIERGILGKIVQGATAPFDGAGKKIATKVTAKVRSKLKDFWDFAGTTIQGATDFGQDAEDSGEGAVRRARTQGLGLGAGYLGDWAQNQITSKITPKVREYLEKNHKVKLYGSNLKALMSESSGLVNEGLQRGFNNSFLDSIVNFLELNDASERGNSLVYDSKQLDLEKAAFMDNRFKLSVVEVIPAWLKKIYTNTYRTAFGKDPSNVNWDFKSSGFVAEKQQMDDLADKVVTKDNIKRQVEAINAWIDALDPDSLMSKPTREFVEKWLIEEKNKGYALNPTKLLANNLKAPKNIKEELLIVIPVLLHLSEDDKELVMSGELSDIFAMGMRGNIAYNDKVAKLADQSVSVRTASSLDLKEIQAAANIPESRRQLAKMGIIIEVRDGEWIINPQFEHNAFKTHARDYKKNARIRYDADGDVEVNVIDDNYSNSDNEIKRTRSLKHGSMHLTDVEKQQRMLDRRRSQATSSIDDKLRLGDDYITSHHGTNFPSSAEYGKDYIKDAFNRIIHKSDPGFPKHQWKRFAAGGFIESFAKGGRALRRNQTLKDQNRSNWTSLKPGMKQGEPDQEFPVMTHGGEMVVNRDATKFNKHLLDAINKFGAPLINQDGSVNSVYHKLFGFKSAKDFDLQGKTKKLASKTSTIANEQIEISIKNILDKMDMSLVKPDDVKKMTDPKVLPARRLAMVLKQFTLLEKNKAKADPKAYAKSLANSGIKSLDGKIDKWIGDDETNKEIKKQLYAMASGGATKIKNGAVGAGKWGLDKAKRTQKLAQARMLDRGATLTAVGGMVGSQAGLGMFEQPTDIYMVGRRSPVFTRYGFANRMYVDQATGELIKKPSHITGTVVNEQGDVRITTEELLFNQFTTKDGTPFKLLGMQESARRFMSSTEYTKHNLSIIAQSDKFKQYAEKFKQGRDKFLLDKPVDVYTRDNPTTPVLLATKFANRSYMDKETGNSLWSHHDITGDVLDTTTNPPTTVLTAEQLADGLFDAKGVQLKVSKLKQFRNNAFRRGNEFYGKYLSKHVKKLSGGMLNAISAMGEKQVGLNFDSNPIDVYVKGETSPRITAAMFKAKKVFDTNSKKIIKSHSGISGEVKLVDKGQITVLLSVEEIQAGLVDGMGERIKLPLLMGSIERFKDYALEALLPSKYLKNVKNYFNLSPEKRQELMNQKIDGLKIAFDVYVKGSPATPILTKRGFEAGQYISVKTGKAVVIPEYIDGPIVDTTGNMVLTEDDLKKGLVDFDGNEVKLRGNGLLSDLKSSLSMSGRMSKVITERLRNKIAQSPVTTGNHTYTIKFSKSKGQGLPSDLSSVNNRKFTDDDIRAGLLVKVGDGEGASAQTEKVNNVKDIDEDTYLATPEKGGGVGICFDSVFMANGYIVDEEGNVITTKWHKGKSKTNIAGKVKGAGNTIKRHLSSLAGRVGSWQWLKDKAASEKKEGKKDDKAKPEKKESWIGKLVKGFMSPMTLLLGGLFTGLAAKFGAMKAAFITGLGWLGTKILPGIARAMMMRSTGALGALGGKGKMLGMLGKGAMVAGAIYGGNQLIDHFSGDEQEGGKPATGDGTTNALPTTSGDAEAEAAAEGTGYSGSDIASMALNYGLPAYAIAQMLKGGDVPDGATRASRWNRAARGARGARAGATAGRGLLSRAGGVLANTGRLASRMRLPGRLGAIANVARSAGGGVASMLGRRAASTAARGGVLNTLGRGAVRVGAATWNATGAVAKGLGAAAKFAPSLLRGAFAIGRFALGPAGWALTAAYYGAKYGLQLWNDHKNPWNRFRMAQYGFDHNDSGLVDKIAQIEGATAPMLKVSNDGSVSFNQSEEALNKILQICGINDEKNQPIEDQKDRMGNVLIWYKERFLRVFASYFQNLKKITGKGEMTDLQKLDRDQQNQLLASVHFQAMETSPYIVQASPFEDPSVCELTFNDVDKLSRKLRDKIAELPAPKKPAVPKGSDPLAAKSKQDPNKSAADKAVDKTIAAEKDSKQDMRDPKTMTDAATKSVKYTADATKAITQVHQKQMIKTAEDTTKQTESMFDSVIGGMQKRLSGWASKIKETYQQDGLMAAGAEAIADISSAPLAPIVKGGQAVADWWNGVGGAMKDAPRSDGKGWLHNKDVIMYASKAVGVDAALMAQVAAVESGFNPSVVNEIGAGGLYQFMPGTWKEMVSKYGKKYGIPEGTPVTDARANALLGAAYIKENADKVKKYKPQVTAVDIYLSHLLGPGGGAKFLKALMANPNALVNTAVGAAAIENNRRLFMNGGSYYTLQQSYNLIGNEVNTKAQQLGVDVGSLKSANSAPTSAVPQTSSAPAGTPAASTTPVMLTKPGTPGAKTPQMSMTDGSMQKAIADGHKNATKPATKPTVTPEPSKSNSNVPAWAKAYENPKMIKDTKVVVQPKANPSAVVNKDSKLAKEVAGPMVFRPQAKSTQQKVNEKATKQQVVQQAAVLAPKDVNSNIRSKSEFIKSLNPQYIELGKQAYRLQDKGVDVRGMNAEFWTIFLAMIGEYASRTRGKVLITSAFRSVQKQKAMYDAWIAGGKKGACVAAPGRSRHNSGVAIDINSPDANALASHGLLAKYRFHRPVRGEAWHLENLLFGNPKATANAIEQDLKNTPSATNSSGVSKPSSSVNQNMNNISSGQGSLATSPFGNQPNSSPTTDVNNQLGGGQVVNLLGRQLAVQEKMLGLLEKIAGTSANSLNKSSDADTKTSAETEKNQAQSGISTPNLDKALAELNGTNQAKPSPFAGIKNPISVSKPV